MNVQTTANKHTPTRLRRIAMLTLLAPAMVAVAGSFDISRSTTDGGGSLYSSGGDYELSGTIGQPDAGRMQAGTYDLTGGFWIEQVPADCNIDGNVDLWDYETFESCMTGPDTTTSGAPCICFDLDGDFDVDMQDAASFQHSFNG